MQWIRDNIYNQPYACSSSSNNVLDYGSVHKELRKCFWEWWLFFNVKWPIFQLFHGEKLHSLVIMSALYGQLNELEFYSASSEINN